MKLRIFIILFSCTPIWGLTQLDSENADRNLTSQATVLTHTPSASVPMQCQGLIHFGDGAKNLSGSSGSFRITVSVGGQTVQPDPQMVYFSTAVRSSAYTPIFPVPANQEVIIKALSPISADTDVDVTAYLFSLDPQINAIETDTDELQTDWTNDGRLDVIIDAIKYKTDLITIHDDTVKTANDANNFIINTGKDANDAFNYHVIMVTDADDSNSELRWISSWYDDGGTDPNVTVDRPFSFTPASGDVVHIMGTSYGGWLLDIYYNSGSEPFVYDFRPPTLGAGGGTTTFNAEDDDP